jgi:hypothetical protein
MDKENQSSNFPKKMPYRRLPNTDKARVRAMDKAFRKCLLEGKDNNYAIAESTFMSLETVLPQFQHALINLDAARRNQISKSKDYTDFLKKARIYISHFIQVLNFAIARGELKSETRDFYGLSAYTNSLPSLITDKDLIEWGKKLIDGEQKRIQKGGNPIYNPSIALVKVNYERFVDAFHFQKSLISTSKRASKLVNSLRPEADMVILQIWNEVEQTFFQLDEIQKRESATEYGVSYVFRKREKLKAQNLIKQSSVEKEKKIEVKPLEQVTKPDIKPTVKKKKPELKPLPEKINIPEKSIPVQSTINF